MKTPDVFEPNEWRDVDDVLAVTILRELAGEARVLPEFIARLDGTPPTPTHDLLIQFASGIELNWSQDGFRLRHSPALQRDWPSPDTYECDWDRDLRERARREVRAAMGSQADSRIDPLTGIMHEPKPLRERA